MGNFRNFYAHQQEKAPYPIEDLHDGGEISKNDDCKRCSEFYSGYGKIEISAIWQKFLRYRIYGWQKFLPYDAKLKVGGTIMTYKKHPMSKEFSSMGLLPLFASSVDYRET